MRGSRETIRRLTVFVLSGALGCAAASGSGGRPALVGQIVGPDGAPIPDVRVETQPPTDRVLTGPQGRFEISRVMPGSSPLPAGRYQLRFTKDGYLDRDPPVVAELKGATVELGVIELPTDDGLRVAPVAPAAETDAGDAAEAGGEVGRGF